MSGLPQRFLALGCALCVFIFTVPVQSSGRMVPQSTFMLEKVKYFWMMTGYVVELEISGNPLPQVHRRSASTVVAEEVPISPDGKVQFWSDDPELTVNLLHPGGYHVIHLELANYSMEQRPGVQMQLQGANSNGEYVFSGGRNVDVKVLFKVTGGIRPNFLALDNMSFAQKYRSQSNVVGVTSGGRFLELLQYSDGYAERFAAIRVKQSRSYPREGILGIQGIAGFGYHNITTSPIRTYEIHAHIPVYQSGHGGPFPDNFLGFEHVEGKAPSGEQACAVGVSDPCEISCFVFGDRPTAVQFERVDGAHNSLNPTARVSIANGGYWAYGHLVFGQLEVGDTAVYRCSSRSPNAPNTISRTISVKAVSRW